MRTGRIPPGSVFLTTDVAEAVTAGKAFPGKCRSPRCNQPIIYVAMHPNGTLSPINPEPSESGRVYLLADGLARVLPSPTPLSAVMWAGPRYQSHFDTCPDAPKFRKPRRPRSERWSPA